MSCSECPASATCSRRVGGARQLLCAACFTGASQAVSLAAATELIGKKSFDEYSAGFGVPLQPKSGSAEGIAAFTRLGKRIGQRIIQVRMVDDPRMPFKVAPVREMMIALHSAYYEAATYFAEWFPGRHRDAKQFARLMEDAVDVALTLNASVLRTLLSADQRSPSVMRDMMPATDRRQVSDIERFAQLRRARVGRLQADIWRQSLSDLFALPAAQVNAVAAVWRDAVLESLQVGLIYLQDWKSGGPALYASVFLRDLVQAFAQFGEALFSAAQRPMNAQIASASRYWQ